MKIVKAFETFISEAKRSTVHAAAKKGDYPVTLVAIENGKVVHQELVNTPMAVPAAFNVMQKDYPKAKIHVEDKGGETLFVEGLLKSKSPNDTAEADIDFAGSDSDLKKVSKKFKLEVDEYEPGMVMLKGKKKDILAYLQSPQYDMDSEDIKDLFPDLLEATDSEMRTAIRTAEEKAIILRDKETELRDKAASAEEKGNEFEEKMIRLDLRRNRLEQQIAQIDIDKLQQKYRRNNE